MSSAVPILLVSIRVCRGNNHQGGGWGGQGGQGQGSAFFARAWGGTRVVVGGELEPMGANRSQWRQWEPIGAI